MNEVFIVMIYSVTRFEAYLEQEANLSSPHPLAKDLCPRYTGDAPLFEIGCYFFFHTDAWLFSEYPAWREAVSLPLAERYIGLFSDALNMPNVGDLFDQRWDMYGILLRRGERPQRFHWYLVQLLHLAAGNGKPSKYDLDKEPVLIADAHTDYVLTSRLLSLFETVAPPFLHGLGKYIRGLSND